MAFEPNQINFFNFVQMNHAEVTVALIKDLPIKKKNIWAVRVMTSGPKIFIILIWIRTIDGMIKVPWILCQAFNFKSIGT